MSSTQVNYQMPPRFLSCEVCAVGFGPEASSEKGLWVSEVGSLIQMRVRSLIPTLEQGRISDLKWSIGYAALSSIATTLGVCALAATFFPAIVPVSVVALGAGGASLLVLGATCAIKGGMRAYGALDKTRVLEEASDAKILAWAAGAVSDIQSKRSQLLSNDSDYYAVKDSELLTLDEKRVKFVTHLRKLVSEENDEEIERILDGIVARRIKLQQDLGIDQVHYSMTHAFSDEGYIPEDLVGGYAVVNKRSFAEAIIRAMTGEGQAVAVSLATAPQVSALGKGDNIENSAEVPA